jgi:hypothetical protein
MIILKKASNFKDSIDWNHRWNWKKWCSQNMKGFLIRFMASSTKLLVIVHADKIDV